MHPPGKIAFLQNALFGNVALKTVILSRIKNEHLSSGFHIRFSYYRNHR